MISRLSGRFAVTALAALFAAAITPAIARPVQVTRFVAPDSATRLGQPIAVILAPGGDASSLELQLWVGAVSEAFADAHFASGAPGTAPLVAEVREQSAISRVRAPRAPKRISVGFSNMHYGHGAGFGMGGRFGGERNRAQSVHQTALIVTIRDRASGQALWEGRAGFATESDSKDTDPAHLSRRMAHALLKDFPGRSGETIAVK